MQCALWSTLVLPNTPDDAAEIQLLWIAELLYFDRQKGLLHAVIAGVFLGMWRMVATASILMAREIHIPGRAYYVAEYNRAGHTIVLPGLMLPYSVRLREMIHGMHIL